MKCAICENAAWWLSTGECFQILHTQTVLAPLLCSFQNVCSKFQLVK